MLNCAAHCKLSDCFYGVINDCESFETTFEIIAFVVNPFRYHSMMTQQKHSQTFALETKLKFAFY